MATISDQGLPEEMLYPCITLAHFLTRFGACDIITSQMQYYLLSDQTVSFSELDGKYSPLENGANSYSLHFQRKIRKGTGEQYACEELQLSKCPHFCKPVLTTFSTKLRHFIFIKPHYNDYCRQTLQPHTQIVMRQLLKALVCLRKKSMVHKNIRPESITWRWNEDETEPHIYLTNFDQIDNGDNTVLFPYIYVPGYKFSEYDVRLAGILMLELLLDQDIYTKYANVNCLIPPEDRLHYYTQIGCTVTCDLIEELIGASPVGRISAKQALKHKYFRYKRTVNKRCRSLSTVEL